MKKNAFALPLILLFIFLKMGLVYGQNPSGISGLKLWLRSDSGVVVNGNNVTGWNDQSGGNFHSIQTNAAAQPLLVPNVLNNLPAISFNGSKVLNGKDLALSNSSFTVFIVAAGGAMSDAYNVLFDLGPYAPGGIWLCKHDDKLTIYSNNAVYSSPGGLPSAGFEPKIFGFKKQLGVLAESFLNFSVVASASGGSFVNPFVSAAYNVGGDPSYSGFWNGDVFEVLVFDKALNNSETTIVSNYLSNKYAPHLDLGLDKVIPPAAGCVPSSSVTLTANPDFKKFLWSTGDTVNQISVNQYGNYSVICTDNFGLLHYDTIKISAPAFSYNYPVKHLLCDNDTIKWDTHLNKTHTFKWQDNSADSLFNITQAGKYYVTITDAFGCSGSSDTVSVTADNISSLISLGNDTSMCAGNFIYLQKGASQVVSYLWSSGSTNDSLLITTTGKYWLTVKSVNNCAATDTIHVTISGTAPSGNFSFAKTCLKNATQFTDLSTAPSGESLASWSWDFGDSNTSALQNPIHVYADTGKYMVQLKVTTLAGCSFVVSKPLTIFPLPKVNYTTTNLCEDRNTFFTSQSTPDGYPVTSWSWNFSDPASGTANVSSLQNPVHLYVNSGDYMVALKAINTKGCVDSVVKAVTIKPTPKTDFSFSLACKDDTVSFKDLTSLPVGVTVATSYWNFINSTSNLLNPINIFSSNVIYNVMHVVTASNGCKDTITKKVDVHASPVARFVSSTSCAKGETVFTDQSLISAGSITGWKWTFENTKNTVVKNPVYSFSKAGNAVVKQVVISDFGCKDSATKTIVVYPRPTAQFTVAPEYGNPGQTVKFTNSSLNAATYIWDFDDKSSSTLVNPVHLYKDTGLFHPVLVAVSTYGCKDTVKSKVSILKRFIDVAITGTTARIQNGGGLLLNDYLNVHVDLVNKSTADIFTMDLYMETNDGPGVKETWTGKWLKGDVLSYDFKTTPSIKEGGHFVCVYVLNPNGLEDEVPIDNKLCNALDETEFKVLSPFPNPTEDQVVIPVIIPSKGELQITIYNSEGKPVKMPYSETASQGLQFITIDAQGFSSGLYVCKVELDEKKSIIKFIKK